MEKERIDVLLVKKGIVDSREKAKKAVMEGIVYANDKRIDKPGETVLIDKKIEIRGNPIPYVGRGGLKLEKAIKCFDLNLKDKIALDVGASTGGFTDCMLKNGVKKVYAIDVGYGQLDWKLRNDHRVIVKERLNARYLNFNHIGEYVNFATIDVSFISLKLILPNVKSLLEDNGEIVALVKPQFEAGREKVGKKGIISDAKVHNDVLIDICNFCNKIGLYVRDINYSPIKGNKGNIEFLLYMTKNKINNKSNIPKTVYNIVAEAHKDLSMPK